MEQVEYVNDSLASQLVEYFDSHVKRQVFLPISNSNIFEYVYEGQLWRFVTHKSSLDLVGIFLVENTNTRVENRYFIEPLITLHAQRLAAEGEKKLEELRRTSDAPPADANFHTTIRHWEVLLNYNPSTTPNVKLIRGKWMDPDGLN